MRPRSLLITCIGALALMSSALVAPANGLSFSASSVAAAKAAAWLETQQQKDGGFEVAKFPGFETPEALLSFAGLAQTGTVWSPAAALRAAQAVVAADGSHGLDYLDDFAEATGDDAISGGVAAKLVTLVAGPMCLDPAAFDPQRDGAVDLVAVMQAAARDNGAFGPDGVFSDTLYAALAHATIGMAVPAKTVGYIEAAQEADGGWNYLGSPDDQGFDDIDTTALAIQALLAAGRSTTAASVATAVDYLVGLQSDDGSWGFGDPNSTAVATLALVAAGATPEHNPFTFLIGQQRDDGRIASPNDSFGVNTYATTQAVRALLVRPLPLVTSDEACRSGYELFAADGGVFTYGERTFHGSAASLPLAGPVVDGTATDSGDGYLLFGADGGVFTFGDATFRGSMGGEPLVAPITGGAATRSGYLLFAEDGGVFSFGDAPFAGSLGSRRLNSPVVSGEVTPRGDGYYLFAADGGVFAFGDAPFFGSMGATKLNKPIVAGAVTPTGRGYVLVASDGGVFAFGDAVFAGSLGAIALNQPVVGAAMSPLGNGYALFAADGGVFAFGDMPFFGSAGALKLNSPVVGGSGG